MSHANPIDLVHSEITEAIIGSFYEVYNELRYGFLERIYVEALVRVLRKRGFTVEREVMVPVHFHDDVLGLQKIDLLVEGKVVVEVKSTHDLAPASHRQLLSYLRGTGLQVGLLLHSGPEAEFHRTICTTRRGSAGSA